MNESTYWLLFDRAYQGSREEAGFDPYQRMVDLLEPLSLADLIDYTKFFSNSREQLLTPSHLAAAYLLFEGTLGFDDYLTYLEAAVGVPRMIFLSVKDYPDAILDLPIYKILLDLDAYPFGTAGISVGKKKFGKRWRTTCEQEFRDSKGITPDCVHYRGKSGYDIVTPELCQELVPRFFCPLFQWL